MKRKELVATLTAYCNDVGIPISYPLSVSLRRNFDYGFIPFSTDKIGEAFENDRWVSSLAGDEGEFGWNVEYYEGLETFYFHKTFYVRQNKRVVSYLHESSGNGFVIFSNDKKGS